jgi:hypothetical protein
MMITVTREELKELETALVAHYQTLDRELFNKVYVGGPNEAGVRKCVQRQQVQHLLDKVRHTIHAE